MKNIKKPYIIGETAFHHEGEIKFLNELIIQAANLKLDAIKFHSLLDIKNYMVKNHDAIPILEKISLSKSSLERAIKLATQKKLDVILLCNDVIDVKWAIKCDLKIRAIEIHSTGINDLFLLEEASKFKNTVLLGVGGSSIDEVKFAIDFLFEKGKKDILLMHGFQNYPTNYTDIFLERIEKFSNLFNLPMGYADHTDPNDENNEWLSVLGLTKGAFIIEKHFTTKFGEKRIDSQSAISIDQMKKVKDLAKILFKVIGFENPLSFSEAELNYGNTGPMKKAPVARYNIDKGERISIENIYFKRTLVSSSVKQRDILKILGLKTKQKIKMDEIIDFSKVEFEFSTNEMNQFKNTNK